MITTTGWDYRLRVATVAGVASVTYPYLALLDDHHPQFCQACSHGQGLSRGLDLGALWGPQR